MSNFPNKASLKSGYYWFCGKYPPGALDGLCSPEEAAEEDFGYLLWELIEVTRYRNVPGLQVRMVYDDPASGTPIAEFLNGFESFEAYPVVPPPIKPQRCLGNVIGCHSYSNSVQWKYLGATVYEDTVTERCYWAGESFENRAAAIRHITEFRENTFKDMSKSNNTGETNAEHNP